MSLAPRIDRVDRNLLINGNFRFWQRNITLASAGYCSDRWAGVSGVNSQSRQTNTSGTQSIYMMQVGGASGDIGIGQRVDAAWSRYIVNSTITVSFWARINSGSSTNFAVRIVTPTSPNNYGGFTQTVYALSGLNGTWKQFTTQVNVTASMITNGFAIGIVDIGNVGGVVLQIADVVALDGTFSNISYTLAGDNFADEFMLCQRYYEKSYNMDDPTGTVTTVGQVTVNNDDTASNNCRFNIFFKMSKRITPTITFWNPTTGASGSWPTVTPTVVSVGQNSAALNAAFGGNQNAQGHWTADAEI